MKKKQTKKTSKEAAKAKEYVPKIKEVIVNSLSDPITMVLKTDKSTLKYAIDRLIETVETTLDSTVQKRLEDSQTENTVLKDMVDRLEKEAREVGF